MTPLLHHRVVAQTDHVPLAAVLLHRPPEPVAVHIGVVHMYDHVDIRKSLFRRLVADSGKSCVPVPAAVGVVVFVHQLPCWPEHTVRRLVADLYPFGLDPFFLQRIEHIQRVFAHGFAEQVVVIVLPCRRDTLMLRIGEEIRIMDVYHEPQPFFGGALREGEHILLVAPPGSMVHPYAQPYGVHSALMQ